MRELPAEFASYRWAPSTAAIAAEVGLDPVEIVRFDGNVPAEPSRTARPGAIATALAGVNEYAHGGFPDLVEGIAAYAGVEPENVVLGAGADDLILLCARTFAGAGDAVAIADAPTYPLFRIAAQLAGAEVGSDTPAVTFCCRPNNPTGAFGPLPTARPLVVDEAYFEYAGETAADLIEDGVVVLRTFSKAFGLAGARVGYALASAATAAELNRRQAPQPISGISAALALAALRDPPDVSDQVAERERCAKALTELGLEPLPSRTNFLFVPIAEAAELGASLLRSGLVVRVFSDGIRWSIRDREDDDLLLEVLARAVDGSPSAAPSPRDALDTAAPPPRRDSASASSSMVPVAFAFRRGRDSTTTFSSSSPSTPASTSRSTASAISRPGRTTPPRTPRSRSARRSTVLSAIAVGSHGTETRSCRWTTRSLAPPSISADGPRPR